jgi:hypothetical protein
MSDPVAALVSLATVGLDAGDGDHAHLAEETARVGLDAGDGECARLAQDNNGWA